MNIFIEDIMDLLVVKIIIISHKMYTFTTGKSLKHIYI